MGKVVIKDKGKKTFVNIITFIRLFGGIAIIPVYIIYGGIVAGILATIFFLTDCIDGFLARTLKVQTFFGAIVDAVSDKVFGIVCLILLSMYNPIFLLILVLELCILVVNSKSASNGNNVKSSYAGKAKTVSMGVVVVLSFLIIDTPQLKEYINFNYLNKLLDMNTMVLTSILAATVIVADLSVLSGYLEIKATQDKEKDNTTGMKKISKDELIFRLFDSEFYMNHRDDSIKSLLYKQR